MKPSNPMPTEHPDDVIGHQLRRDQPDHEDNIDAALHLAELRRRFAGADVEPVHFRQWEIERRLGKGGMGAVYLARHAELDRKVALKVLGTFAGAERSDMSRRIRREAQALARIDHPNVVTVHGVYLDRGQPVIEMEFVDGTTLRQWQQQDPTWREILEVYILVGDGLAAIHTAELVHRDIKPDNLLRGADGRVRIVDLGLAIGPRSPSGAPTKQSGASLLNARITGTGGVAGTPAYMAPECLEHAEFGPAADQFAFAVSLYEGLHGIRPFEVTLDIDRYVETVRRAELRTSDTPPRLPGWLVRALRRALRHAPDERHPSMEMLVAELRRGLRARRRWWLGGTVIGLLLGSIGLGWVLRAPAEDPCTRLEQTLQTDEDPLGPLRDRVARMAEPHLDRAIQLLDQTYAERRSAWVDLRLAQCEAQTRRQTPPTDLELRAACLTRNRERLDAIATGPTLDDPDLADWLIDATKQLERMPWCDEDPAQLSSWVPEADPGPRASIDEQLARALAFERAGDYARAEAEARAAMTTSEGVHPRAHAEAQYRLGHIMGADERGVEAFATLANARNAALGAGLDALLCEVVAYRAKLTAVLAVDPTKADDDVGLAESCLERTHARSILVRADMLEARGLLAQTAGEPKRAIDWHRQALELRQTHLGRKSHDVSKSLHNLGNALDEVGQPQQSSATLAEALRVREIVLGPKHPKVADVLADLGEVLRKQGEAERARVHLERALQIYATAHGPDTPHGANVHLSLAMLELEQGRLPAAEAQLRRVRALQQHDRNLGPHHPDLALLLQAEGILHVKRRNYALALEVFAQGTELLRWHAPDGP